MYYGTLTEQGRTELGIVFPDNLVPLVTVKVHKNLIGFFDYYYADYRMLTERQQFDLCHILAKKFKADWQAIHKEFAKEWKFAIRKELIIISTDTRYIG